MNLLQLFIEFIWHTSIFSIKNNAGFDEQLAYYKVKLILTKKIAILELLDSDFTKDLNSMLILIYFWQLMLPIKDCFTSFDKNNYFSCLPLMTLIYSLYILYDFSENN